MEQRVLGPRKLQQSLVNIININAAANDSKDIPVNETVERGGVAVTLEKLELTEKETQLTYSYDSTSGGTWTRLDYRE